MVTVHELSHKRFYCKILLVFAGLQLSQPQFVDLCILLEADLSLCPEDLFQLILKFKSIDNILRAEGYLFLPTDLTSLSDIRQKMAAAAVTAVVTLSSENDLTLDKEPNASGLKTFLCQEKAISESLVRETLAALSEKKLKR